MVRGCVASVLIVLVVSVLGWGDTLTLKDGRVLSGRLTGLTATTLAFRLPTGTQLILPLREVARLEMDWVADPTPRVKKADWQRAVDRAQRAFFSCRWSRQGLILGGILFMAGGFWLTEQGYGPLGGVVSALGAMSAVLGIITPAPPCAELEAQLKLLVRIGLDHDWLY